MNNNDSRRAPAKTCWSCEGDGHRYKSSNGRAYREPCPTCRGTGQIDIANKTTSLHAAVRWIWPKNPS